MYYSNIKKNDISNGVGLRVSLYVSGCTLRCKGCFNPETWNFKFGKLFTEETLEEIIKASNSDLIKGLTILGGEPLEPDNQEKVYEIIKKYKSIYPNKNIWMFTGYTLDDKLKKWQKELPYTKKILDSIDVLVEGPFVQELFDINLGFRGSSNQRIIDMNKTRLENKVILHEKHYNKELKNIWK